MSKVEIKRLFFKNVKKQINFLKYILIKNKNTCKLICLHLKTFKKNYIYVIKGTSFFLLIYSPILSLLWLLGPTIYFLWKRNYKAIFKIWGFTLGIWFLIFTTCLSGATITIGEEHTKVLLKYMLDNITDIEFEKLCFQTVYILDAISSTVGFTFHFPSTLLPLLQIFKFFKMIGTNISNISSIFKTSTTQCSDEKNSNKSSYSYWWNSQSRKKSDIENSFETCRILEKQLRNSENIFNRYKLYKAKSDINGDRTITYRETWFPFHGTHYMCTSSPISDFEKELYNKINKS